MYPLLYIYSGNIRAADLNAAETLQSIRCYCLITHFLRSSYRYGLRASRDDFRSRYRRTLTEIQIAVLNLQGSSGLYEQLWKLRMDTPLEIRGSWSIDIYSLCSMWVSKTAFQMPKSRRIEGRNDISVSYRRVLWSELSLSLTYYSCHYLEGLT